MKIAYLVSRYPAVSHTFVLREVLELRARGIDVGTFSIRRAGKSDVLGEQAEQEAKKTRWLVPMKGWELLYSIGWGLGTRPIGMLKVLMNALCQKKVTFIERLTWGCYFLEAVILARWLVCEKYEHLHCHFGNSGSSTAMLAAELAGIPFSVTCHGSELLDIHRYKLPEKVERAKFVVCISQYGRSQLMMNCPASQWSKLHLVRCGLSFEDNRQGSDRVSGRNILCVGRLSREKGHLVLLDALARLDEQGCEFTCTLVGDGPMRKQIEERARALHLDGKITMTGALPAEKVQELYFQVVVFVLASFSEGVPVVLMEAMAAGCPVVSTHVGGIPELVENQSTGLLVAPGDSEELAKAIRWMLENPEYAQTMARQARVHVREHFHLEKNVDALVDLFKQNVQTKINPQSLKVAYGQSV